ncbi:cytochrome ubiquinol oxidase subunit I [Actinophytocola sp.]|uniref:cytochrome ubiquinol oxidase subunit I n=1 Tax=Actinophytocola sp. TaxID=1872138 RepID=UPI003899F10E
MLTGGDPIQLLPAREQMAFTLGFHIILVPFGIAFTFLMLVANYRGIRHGDADALRLARRWSKVAAVLFAVGAVSGTVLSFELGLLWPGLMGRYGAAYGIPFAVEGIFFFLEAIFVSIYIYGWRRMRPWPHFWAGVPVPVAGLFGAMSVVAANGWMNLPGGFTLRDGRVVSVDPLAVYFNRAFWYEALHMFLAAYIVAGFTVAGVYAVGMLKGRRDAYHRRGFLIAFTTAAVVTPAQIFVGDVVSREVFHAEPAKFAAIELVPHTGTHVPEKIGGVLVDGRVRYGLEIPDVGSVLAGLDPATRIRGLDAVPARVRPPAHLVNMVHLSFDVMVLTGFALLALAAWFGIAWWRRRDLPRSRWFLRATALAGVTSVVSLECGWIVTEVGRQPWIVVGHLLTRDAVTTSGNMWLFFAAVLVIYAAIGTGAVLAIRAMRRRWASEPDETVTTPYGPRGQEVPS